MRLSKGGGTSQRVTLSSKERHVLGAGLVVVLPRHDGKTMAPLQRWEIVSSAIDVFEIAHRHRPSHDCAFVSARHWSSYLMLCTSALTDTPCSHERGVTTACSSSAPKDPCGAV